MTNKGRRSPSITHDERVKLGMASASSNATSDGRGGLVLADLVHASPPKLDRSPNIPTGTTTDALVTSPASGWVGATGMVTMSHIQKMIGRTS